MSLSQLENKIKARQDSSFLAALQGETGLPNSIKALGRNTASGRQEGVGAARALFPSSCPNEENYYPSERLVIPACVALMGSFSLSLADDDKDFTEKKKATLA